MEETFPFIYQGEDSGSGEFWIDDFNKFNVKSEMMEQPHFTENTLENNIKLRHYPFILKLEQVDYCTGQLIIQNYGKSLENLIDKEPEKVIKKKNGSITPYGVQLVMLLFNHYSFLYNNHVSYWPGNLSKNVVFMENDENFEYPYLLPLDSGDNSLWRENMKNLSTLIESLSPTPQHHKWLDDFLFELNQNYKKLDFEKLERHPIFWMPWDLKDFILRIRDMENRIKKNSQKTTCSIYSKNLFEWFSETPKYKNWRSDIEQDMVFKKFYKDSTKLFNTKYDDSPSSLVNFIRNAFIHFNDRAVWEAYMKFTSTKSRKMLTAGLEDYFKELYPELILNLFNDVWEKVVDDGLQNDNEWPSHSVRRGMFCHIPGDI